MKFGNNNNIQQVNEYGQIEYGVDESLSTSELYNVLYSYFPNISYDKKYKLICGEYKNKSYTIRVKNITYLGNPHPSFKKRIQIANDLKEFYNLSIKLKKHPILLGVYSYCGNIVFCEFAINNFINKGANNSSAHVYASDIQNAVIDDYFQKVDGFGNRITAFSPIAINNVLNEILNIPYESKRDVVANEKNKNIKSQFSKVTINKLSDFFSNQNKTWLGMDCYDEMCKDNYKNKFQAEWAGFYLEYKMEKYVNDEHIEDYIKILHNKKNKQIDLDLFFKDINSFGDLKMHSEESRGIQGNDKSTIFSILNSKKYYNHIYYIVCEHSTIKDSTCGYVVTKFWNRLKCKNKKVINLMSYSARMKNRVTIRKWMILDINNDNKNYLTIYKQGLNSNGKPRKPKIMVESDNIKKFSIYEETI